MLRSAWAASVLFSVAACGGASGPRTAGPEVVREMVGDTQIVRTVSGSAWGAPARLVSEVAIGALDGDPEYLFGSIRTLAVGSDGAIYAVDSQARQLRVYNPDGSHRITMGGSGEGPGELKGPDGGLTILSDGRILVRDPGNGRIQVFGPDGTALDTWPIRGGFNTGDRLYRDHEDNVYTQLLLDPEASVFDWVIGMVRIDPEGLPHDTLTPPDAGYEAPDISVSREGSTSINPVPFSPDEDWTFHPDRYFVHGVSTDYRFTLLKPEGPLRVEREFDPVAVTDGERREEELRATRSMQRTDPNWRWNGPRIPDTKPPFRDFLVGEDGRIWVRLWTEAIRREDLSYDAADPDAIPNEWTEPVAYDVFEDDGTYVGRVETPEGFRSYPYPVFNGDYVWGVTADELDVLQIHRFRIVLEEESGTD